MTEKKNPEFGDPVTAPFWKAAMERRLIVQRCNDCGTAQFYPRCFCLSCQSLNLGWIDAKGRATIYSMVTVRMPIIPELAPPYRLALVELDEGVRMLTNIVGAPCKIGDRVQLAWRVRENAPPLPVFSADLDSPADR